MQLKASRTITLHDVSLKEIYDKLLAVLNREKKRSDVLRWITRLTIIFMLLMSY